MRSMFPTTAASLAAEIAQKAAESAPSLSTNKYAKVSDLHFCNGSLCAQFFIDYLFLLRFILTIYF